MSPRRALAGGAQRYLSGVAMLGLAAVTWAAYGLAQKQLLRRLRAQGIMLCVYVGCLVCFWPWAHPSALASVGALPLALLLFCAVNTLVAYGAFASALEHWEASRVSAVIALTPLATLAFSSLAAVEGRTVNEAEINPLIVGSEGEGVAAVDGLIVLGS